MLKSLVLVLRSRNTLALAPSAEEPCTCAEEPEYRFVLRSHNTVAFVPSAEEPYTCAEEP